MTDDPSLQMPRGSALGAVAIAENVDTVVDVDNATDVDIVIPVFNEAGGLADSVRNVHRYLTDRFPLSWTITIADNESTDDTLTVATDVAHELGDVRVLHRGDKGRGRALRAAWASSSASVVAYMDVYLSTDL